jgi:ribonuclease HI
VSSSSDALAAIDYDSISVDVGTNGNPGPVEYKGVDTKTGEVIFSHGPIRKGTNNLGEFLAIVHALAYLKKQGSSKTVYSDSENALKWVRQKAVSSTLVRDKSTEEIWDLVDRAEKWLRTNTYDNKVLKWQTKQWGEIKADYGRK